MRYTSLQAPHALLSLLLTLHMTAMNVLGATQCQEGFAQRPCTVGGSRLCQFPAQIIQSGSCVVPAQCPVNTYLTRMWSIDPSFVVTREIECKPYTECGSGEYLFFNGRVLEISDNICRAYTVCGDNQQETGAPTATSDRVCSSIPNCDPTREVSTTINGIVVCVRIATCDLETQYRDAQSNQCVPRVQCDAGYRRLPAEAEDQDSQCEICPPGTYSVGGAVSECTPCEIGSFSSQEGVGQCTSYGEDCFLLREQPSALSELQCVPNGMTTGEGASLVYCGDRFKINLVLNDQHAVCDECKSDGDTLVRDGVVYDCVPCQVNQYCTKNTVSDCPTGYTFGRPGAAAQDERLHTSLPGATELAGCVCTTVGGFEGAPYALGGCRACKSGYYANEDTGMKCVACPSGSYSAREYVTAIQDGTGTSVPITVGAASCTPCPADRPYTWNGISDSPDDCHACPEGQYKDAGTGACLPCTACDSDTQYETSPCSQTQDTTCVTCDPARWANCPLGTYPIPCQAGYDATCIACENLPSQHASWVDKLDIDGEECPWKCDEGFYQVYNQYGAASCAQCTELPPYCDPGYQRVECTQHTDASCAMPCANGTKPLANAEWVRGCEWQCKGGRKPLWMEGSGIYICSY